MPPTPEQQTALAAGINTAREKVELLLKASMMDMDIAVTDKRSMSDGEVLVTIKIKLVSEAGRRSFGDGSLRSQVYPGLKGIYLASLREQGFEHVTILTDTDFSK